MGTKKILSVTAVEMNDSLTVAARVSLTTEDGQTCTRHREITYDVQDEACCVDDWIGEIMNSLDDPNETHSWIYDHGKGCEQHEETHGDL